MRNNREWNLSARCTLDERQKIKRYALKSGKSISQYMIDCSLAPMERNTEKVKRCLISNVRLSEQVNQVEDALRAYKEDLKENSLIMLENKIHELGDLLCQF